MSVLLIVLGFAAVALFVSVKQRRSENCDLEPKWIVFDAGGQAPQPASAPIPRVIWSYWHASERPLVVERCLANWRRHNPGFVIHLVQAHTLQEFVAPGELPTGFAQLTPARQSDWLRLYLLSRHGGVWLDASMILTRPLDWLLEAQQRHGAGLVGFYTDRLSTRHDPPIIDSWCLAAPAGEAFISAWYEELTHQALRLGDAAYLQTLEQRGIRERLLQGIEDSHYLIIHVAAQRVLHDGSGFRVALLRAEDSAYFYQHVSRWRRPRLYARLLLFRGASNPPPLIKLRGGERRKLEPYLGRGCYRHDSLVAQELMREDSGTNTAERELIAAFKARTTAPQWQSWLINLDRSSDRLAVMDARLHELGMPYDRVAGVDGRLLPTDELAHFTRENHFYKPLIPGQVGCYLSHVKVLRQFLESGQEFALIIEDDSVLPEVLPALVDAAVEQRLVETHSLAQWDVLKLHRKRRKRVQLAALPAGYTVVEYLLSVPSTTAAAVWTREGARKFLARYPGVGRPVDCDLQHPWEAGLSVRSIHPPPVSTQGGSLMGARRAGMHHPLSKIFYEAHRVGGRWRDVVRNYGWSGLLCLMLGREIRLPPR